MSLLEIRDLKITFGGLDALSGLNFHIDEGEIVSIIGPNGAGKTTFFNAISGLVVPTEGAIDFEGASILGMDPSIVT
jgi:branched-chain amino acid transport system ATP-binding protein